MADNIIKVNVTSVKQQRVSVSSSQVGTEITASGDTGRFWAQTAKNWAVADAIVDNTDYSSKHYAQEAKTSAQNASNYEVSIRETAANAVTEIQGAKKSAISDIDTTAKNYDNLTHKNITNCITEIPQRIKLELDNGTLTLKAGSKIIVPNGFESDGKTLKFATVTIQNDITRTDDYKFDGSILVFVNNNGTVMFTERVDISTSGTQPGNFDTYGTWYDTTTNKMKRTTNNGTSWGEGYAFPIALCTRSNTTTTQIDSIFNGFGIIGSTLFCDKGIKVLIPNGKNVDGSLKNIEYTTPKVITGTLKDARSNTYFCLHNNGTLALRTGLKYNEDSNYNYLDAVGNISGVPFAIGTTTTNGVITKYKSFTNAVCLADANKTVSKLGDTMFGTLTSEANNGSEIHIKGDEANNWLTIKGTSGKYDYNDYTNVPTELLRNLRLISSDKNGVYYFYQQVGAEKTRNMCDMMVKRKLTNGTEKTCRLLLRVQDNGDNTLLINNKPLQSFVTETYVSGTSWYRVWSDGWIEQGGRKQTATSANKANEIKFLKSFSNENYTAIVCDQAYPENIEAESESGDVKGWGATGYATDKMYVFSNAGSGRVCNWYVCGY